MATNTWFVMIPPSYASKSTAEKELVDFRVQYAAGTQAWNDANAGKILSASESGEGQQLVKWQGPFATEAEAQTAQNPQQQSLNPVNDATNAAENATGALGIPASIGNFFGDLTQPNLWIRVLKIVLGGALVIVGIIHMTGGADSAGVTGTLVRKLPGL
jgi:hypothetical protein